MNNIEKTIQLRKRIIILASIFLVLGFLLLVAGIVVTVTGSSGIGQWLIMAGVIIAVIGGLMLFGAFSIKIKKKEQEKIVENEQKDEVKICPQCGAENRPGAKFCDSCGKEF